MYAPAAPATDALDGSWDDAPALTPAEAMAVALHELDRRFPWRLHAACRGRGATFFDLHGNAARAVCGGCPVRADCLAFALRFGPDEDRAGIFGGVGPRDRKRMRVALHSVHARGGVAPFRDPHTTRDSLRNERI